MIEVYLFVFPIDDKGIVLKSIPSGEYNNSSRRIHESNYYKW
jgi:hypothetical protein